jgi:predicted Zn-dependent protease
MCTAIHQKGRRLWAAAFFFVQVTACAQSANDTALSQQAKELMAQGQFAQAVPIYRDLLKRIPGNNGLLLNLAMAETMSGEAKQAIPHCRAVLEHDAQSVPALTMLSMAELQLNQPAAAVPPLRKLVQLQPEDINARGMLAGALMSTNDFPGAATQYRKLSSLAPQDAKAWYGLGKAYEAIAGESFQALLKLDGQSPYVAELLGETRLQQRQLRSAFFFFKEAEKQMPNLGGVHQGLATVYSESGHSDWAAVEHERERSTMSACAPQSKGSECAYGREQYADLLQRKGRDPQSLYWATRSANQLAINAFKRLGELPASAELHIVKAQIFHDHKQDLQAAGEWEQAIPLAPPAEQARLQAEHTKALFLGRDYARAIPLLEDHVRQEPDSAEWNFMLGESLWRSQQGEKALPYLQKATQLQPDLLPAQADLGLVLLSLGKAQDALPLLERAKELDDDGSLHYSLARAYQASGKGDAARKAMEEYRAIQNRNNQANTELAKEAEIQPPA